MTRHMSVICMGLAMFAVASSASAEEKLLELGAKEWKYLDTGDDPGNDWNKAEFDDSKWKSGQALLGFGDDDIKQTISFGDDDENKRTCTFFRRTVEVKDPSSAKKFLGKLICDDGCVVYVNGEEVHRFNLPDGKVKSDTNAKMTSGGELERLEMTVLVDPAKFKPGKNIIAIRVHQATPNSSDLAFDMSLEALPDDEAVETAQRQFDEEKRAIQEFEEQQAF